MANPYLRLPLVGGARADRFRAPTLRIARVQRGAMRIAPSRRTSSPLK